MQKSEGNWWGIIVTIFLAVFGLIGTSIIQNDRIRAEEDQKIMIRVNEHDKELSTLKEGVLYIKEDLGEIKAILKRSSPYERTRSENRKSNL